MTRVATRRKPVKPAPVVEKRKVGRPSLYRPEYAPLATKFCMLGATNEDLARMFEVSLRTVDKWLAEIEEFSRAVKEGREEADARVANSLYRRATGYSHEAVKIVADARTGQEHIVPYIERYPPETVAAIFWLKNRRPDLWRDKQHVEQRTTVDAAAELREFLQNTNSRLPIAGKEGG